MDYACVDVGDGQEAANLCTSADVIVEDIPLCGNTSSDSPRSVRGVDGFLDNLGCYSTPRRSPRLKEKSQTKNSDGGKGGKDAVLDDDAPVVVPEVGMVFNTMLELEHFYKRYAKSVGFGVTRAQGSYHEKTGERRATTWRCNCFGDPDGPMKRKSKARLKGGAEFLNNDMEVCNPQRRKSKKCGCDARIYGSINEAKKWVIQTVVLEHIGHIPKPSNVKLVKEYRIESITPTMKRRILSDYHSGVPVSKIMNCFAHEMGGFENLPFTEADIRHVVHEHRRLKMQGGDTNALISYFDQMHRDNPNFFHTHRLDAEGFMKDIFWVDARSVAAYEEFSDVVCFDTTYLTNQYSLPFANFVGVNHHGQTVLFGCALISNEDSDTFEWVFRQWLECMKGKAPGGILTDQAAAMRRPLEVVMPHTRHRWCIWHILQKLPYKLGSHAKYEELKDALLDAVYDSLSDVDFERRWQDAVVKFGVESNEWLCNLFEERHMWVPSFMTDHFWAGMRSTQRCESINSFFDQFLTRDTPFCDFGEKYVAAVEKRISEEKFADEKVHYFKRHLSTGYILERFFRSVYTCNIFRRFQQECERMTYVMVDEEKQINESLIKYLIQDRVWKHSKEDGDFVLVGNDRIYYCVDFNVDSRDASCNCKKFETDGIMCRHLVRVFDKLQVTELPEKFILRRWRKDVERRHSSVRVAFHDLTRTEEVKRFQRLQAVYEPVYDLAAKCEETTQIVIKGVQRIQEEVKSYLEAARLDTRNTSEAESNAMSQANSSMSPYSEASKQTSGTSVGMQSQCGDTSFQQPHNATPSSLNSRNPSIKDPPIPKKRGRPLGSRYKCSSETGWKSSKKKATSDLVKKGGVDSKKKSKKNANERTVGAKSKKSMTGEELFVDGCNQGSQPEKMPVKRRKCVSFAVDLDNPIDPFDLRSNMEDDLMCRNGLSFDHVDPNLNLN